MLEKALPVGVAVMVNPDPGVVAVASVPYCTLLPGLGKSTSSPSTVVQPLPTSQANISGRSSMEACRFHGDLAVFLLYRCIDVLWIWTRTQFWYISLLPMRLNQDHESNTVFEAGAKLGIVKLSVRSRGQPPIKDWMTLKLSPLSYEREIWQEPPMCVALPASVKL